MMKIKGGGIFLKYLKINDLFSWKRSFQIEPKENLDSNEKDDSSAYRTKPLKA